MKETMTPRLMIAAPKSGGGKTTIVCALLRALQKMGLTAAAFKSGPDYIDPLFHSRVLQTASHNLDLFYSEEASRARRRPAICWQQAAAAQMRP